MNLTIMRFKKILAQWLGLGLALPLLLSGTAPSLAGNSNESAHEKIKPKFNSACASCHGKDGAGTPLGKSMQAPDLRSEQVQKHGDPELAQIIVEGKGNMPSFKETFTQDQIRALVQYVRELARKKEPSQK